MDFNNALTEPITKHLAGSWEYAFSHYLSERLDILDESPIKKSFASFRAEMNKRMQQKKGLIIHFGHPPSQILERGFEDTIDLKAMISTGQKEASRLFIPAISAVIADAYSTCIEETCKGCFKRMKAHIIQYVDEERERMFQQTTKETETALKGTIDNGESAMRTKVEEIVTLIDKSYTPMFGIQNIFTALSVARNEVYELLGQVDDCFKEALQGTAEPVKSIQPDETAATTIDSEATAAHEQNAAAQASTSPADISISDSINYGVPDAVFVKRKAAPAGDPTGGVSIKRE